MSDTADNLPPLASVSSELTELIDFARSDLPTDEQWATLSAQVANVWGGATPASTDSPSADSPSAELQPPASPIAPGAEVVGGVKLAAPLAAAVPGAVKAVGVVALTGALASAVWLGTERASGPRAQAVPVDVATTESQQTHRAPRPSTQQLGTQQLGTQQLGTQQPSALLQPDTAPAVEPASELSLPPANVIQEPSLRAADDGSRAPAAPVASKPSELSLLTRARDQLNRNPEQSLALCRQHQRLYPRGQLAQEREVLTIEALTRLKRDREASQRRTQFGKTFPDSPHQTRVKQGSED